MDEDQEEGTALPDRRTRIDGPPLLLPPLPSPWRGTLIAVAIVAAVAAAIACAAILR